MGDPRWTLGVGRWALGFIAASLVLSGCGSEEKSSRGLEVLPDMFHTPAHKSQTAIARDEVASNGAVTRHEASAMLAPMPGTVPRGFVPYALAASDWTAAKRLVNPLAADRAVLRLGQTRFNQTCATCHGRDGDAAHGNLAKYFSGVPSINTANVAGMSDGEVYHIVSVGRNRMPHFRSHLPPTERWAVVTYTKTLARATLAAADAKALTDSTWAAAASNPADPTAMEAVAKAKAVVAQRQQDLDAILSLGDGAHQAAEVFAPLPEPVPEGGKPRWPSEESNEASKPHAGEGHP